MLSAIARPIPMKRELKVLTCYPLPALTGNIARPIPMKRELKDLYLIERGEESVHRKAHPDEKGTESMKYRA